MLDMLLHFLEMNRNPGQDEAMSPLMWRVILPRYVLFDLKAFFGIQCKHMSEFFAFTRFGVEFQPAMSP